MACRFSELVVDSRDPEALAAFWAAVLGLPGARPRGGRRGRDRAGGGLRRRRRRRWSSARSPTRRRGSCRLHIDVNPTDRDQDAELERLLALGAVPADVGQTGDESWHVLADPEGNEFCLLQRRLDPL